jgi:hypothetical protein
VTQRDDFQTFVWAHWWLVKRMALLMVLIAITPLLVPLALVEGFFGSSRISAAMTAWLDRHEVEVDEWERKLGEVDANLRNLSVGGGEAFTRVKARY